MEAVDRDDCLYALGETFSFFHKEILEVELMVWRNFILKHRKSHFLEALRLHMETSRYCPKPKDIGELIKEIQAREEPKQLMKKEVTPTSNCPPEIEKAWMWAVKRFSGMDLFGAEDVSPEQEDRYLEIVNKEAYIAQNPDAIPAQFKLASVWGETILLQEAER